MKICQVAPRFFYEENLSNSFIEKGYHLGGVEKHVYHLSKELANTNDVTIFTTRSPKHHGLTEADIKCKVERIRLGIPVYASSLPISAIRHFNPNDYEVIHAHTPTPGLADLAALKNLPKKRPFVLTFHNDISKKGTFGNLLSSGYNASSGKFLLNHADIIITTTKSYATNSRQLKKYMDKVRVIPNGVDLRKFSLENKGEKIRSLYNLPIDALVILFVGTLDSYKGCDYLLSSFIDVAKLIPNAYLIYVGRGPLEGQLREKAVVNGIGSRVFFAGYVTDGELSGYYSACDIFVLPSVASQHEGFGMVQLEAMASGKPVVTTTIPGVCEVDLEERATLHVNPKDTKALADAMITLLSNEKLRKEMGLNGRNLVEEKYSWKKVAGMTEEVYREVS